MGDRLVVVEIRGGCLQAVFANPGVRVVVVDWDNIECGDGPFEYDPHPMIGMLDDTREQVDKVLIDGKWRLQDG